jgi:hypothetical protein
MAKDEKKEKGKVSAENGDAKKLYKKWWFWLIIVILVLIVAPSGNSPTTNSDNSSATSNSLPAPNADSGVSTAVEDEDQTTAQSENANQNQTNETSNANDTADFTQPKQAQGKDLSSVQKEFTLSAGNYTAGIDFPAGVADVEAVSGTGNLISSNLYNGGVNEMFGIDKDGTGLYSPSFNGLKLPKDTVLTINQNLIVKLDFVNVTSDFAGRSYDETKAVTLSDGNYTAGTDFPAGIYKIVAISGAGNLSSSNMFNDGLNEMFGIDPQGTGLYSKQFLNVNLDEGVTLSLSGGIKIKLTPSK